MSRTTFPNWIYDGSPIPDPFGYGEQAVQFLRSLKHPQSGLPGSVFQLDEWQERIVRRIYGPRHPNGTRIVKDVWLQVPRGNRKTSLAAALSLLHLFGPEAVPKGQIYFAAADRKQATIGFDEALSIIRADKRLNNVVSVNRPEIGTKVIRCHLDDSVLQAASSDGDKSHGTTPTFVMCDEIHVWKNRKLWDALWSGRHKRGALFVTCTTAGRGRHGFAYERYSTMRKIALGEIVNPSKLPIIFEPGEDDDWLDEAVWRKVNPGLAHGYPLIEEMRDDAITAQHDPIEGYTFRQYTLNEWLGNSTSPLFNFDEYDKRVFKDEDKDLALVPCYLGVDYAQSGDLAAIVAAWRHPDGQITIRPWFFVPSEGLDKRARLEGLPYREWIKAGHIIEVPGPIITQEVVKEQIVEICAANEVHEVAYDRYKFRVAATELLANGIPMLEIDQGLKTMGPANGELVRLVNGRMIRHNGHPVLRNHFAGVAAVERNGLIWLSKADLKHGHIDGAVASAMAVSRAVTAQNKRSRYDDPDVTGLFVL